MKFYPSDWRSDFRLKMCSLTARGLWIDLMSYMHEGDPYGHLIIEGQSPSLDTIVGLVGRPASEVKKAFAELEEKGVFSRTEKGIIFSRRMVRDFEKLETDKANGKDGGNPRLKGGVNPHDNRSDKPSVDEGDKAQWHLAVSSSSLPFSATTLESKEVKEEQACGRRKQKTGMPADFVPSRSVPAELGWDETKFENEFKRFVAYVEAHGKIYVNWQAAWGNWCRSPFQQSNQQGVGNGREDKSILATIKRQRQSLENEVDSPAIPDPFLRLSSG